MPKQNEGLAPNPVESAPRSAMSQSSPIPVARVRRIRPAAEGSPRVAISVGSFSPLQWLQARQVSWRTWCWQFLKGEGGAGSSISLVVHLVILALLAIPVYRHLQQGSPLVTEVREAEAEQLLITTEVDLADQLRLPDGEGGGLANDETEWLTELTPSALASTWTLNEAGPTKVAGAADAIGDAGGSAGGVRIREPANAVRRGSFTAFTVPIVGRNQTSEPGTSPRPGQDYYIVVQITVPGTRKIYPLRDLKGLIVGTDGYRQRVPENAFVMEEDGQLVPLAPTRSLKVVDGVVQIFIRVPGASRLVRDEIQVQSALLRETQELALTFQ